VCVSCIGMYVCVYHIWMGGSMDVYENLLYMYTYVQFSTSKAGNVH